MEENKSLYPKSPDVRDFSFLKPTTTFRKVVYQVIVSIVFFMFFYVFLVAVSLCLLVLCFYLAFMLLALKIHWVTLAAALGLIGLGIMFFLFLIKFIFSQSKDEDPHRQEIKPEDQPELFAFIEQLSQETKTQFPKKIFLIPDVNAFVFYNSNFWSMFIPVRKNLAIGLGLVNSLNISEFKSVLAHEFGHFSQRSMQLGSYIYTVNRVIYNMVFEYDYWDRLLAQWANSGGIIGFFAQVTFWLVSVVRQLLKIAYNLININYMKLSREMEYNADLVAVSAAGNEAFIRALRKIEFASFAYSYTSNLLNQLAEKEKASANLYSDHQFMVNHLAYKNKLRFEQEQIIITDEDLEKNLIKSRVNIEDQWASHPSLKEREANLSKVQLKGEMITDSAWKLFRNIEQLQTKSTQNIYEIGFPGRQFENILNPEFQNFVKQEEDKNQVAEFYHGFYDNRFLGKLDLEATISELGKASLPNPDELYTQQNKEFIRRYWSDCDDLEILKQISQGKIKVRYFEFDHVKYKSRYAQTLIRQFSKEVSAHEKQLLELDKNAFLMNLALAQKNQQEENYLQLYKQLILSQELYQQMSQFHQKNQNFYYEIYSKNQWAEEEIDHVSTNLYYFEGEFQKFIKNLDLNLLLENISSEEIRNEIQKYVQDKISLIKRSVLEEENFIRLSNLIYDAYQASESLQWQTLKKLTDFQLNWYSSHPGSSVLD
ncbi:MAG: M48 family metallopeptidase [Microscillaceae bacterium]|nr:M48 family metallopeptidase [Microscillaceae bacterium]